MASSHDPTAEKLAAARTSLAESLASIEAAIATLRSSNHGVQYVSAIETKEFQAQLQNATVMVALSIQRLEDASRRLSKRLGQDVQALNKLVRSSIPIQVTNRLANSWKHGLGGQNSNATILNGIVRVNRADGYRDPSGKERVHVAGMLIADAKYGTFVSVTLFQYATAHWATILKPIDATSSEWLAQMFPKPRGPVVDISNQSTPVVPVGSAVTLELPKHLRAMMQKDAKKRGDAA
jgi:hypothetical protein